MSTPITFLINEKETDESQIVNIEELMNDVNTTIVDDLTYPQMVYYNEHNVKELLTICEYYGFSKQLKANKCNKQEILQCLVAFESDPANTEIVIARQHAWFYISELKKDPFMRKFVIW